MLREYLQLLCKALLHVNLVNCKWKHFAVCMSKILGETHYTLEFFRCAYLNIVVQIDTLRGDVGANEDVHLWTRKLVGAS